MKALDLLKSKRPMLMTKATFEETIQIAVSQAVMEEANWGGGRGGVRREQGDGNGISPNDPFNALRFDGYDRSSLYRTDEGRVIFPDDSITVREKVRNMGDGRLKKAITGLASMIEIATAGWVTIGGSGAGMFRDRDIIPEQLFLAQDAAVLRVRADPHASGIVNNLQYYTVGQGVTWGSSSKEVTEWLTEFRKTNKLEMRERKMVKEIFQEGEYFSVFFVDPSTGRAKMRKWRPKEITEIETHPQDMESRFAYHRQVDFLDGTDDDKWYQDIDYEKQLKDFDGQHSKNTLESDIYIQMSKYGDQDSLRGWPPMYSVLRWLKYLEDFIVDRARLHHEQAKVIWFMQRKGTASRKGSAGSGGLNPLLAPKGGSMWIEDDTVSYRAQALDLNSSDAEKDALLIIYAISSGTQQPMHVWNQRSDQAVYASLRKADTPFSQSILSNQKFHEEEWEERDAFIVRKGVEHGSLPEEVEIIKHDETLVIRALQKINEMVADNRAVDEIVKEAGELLAPGMKKMRVPTVEVPITRTFPEMVQEAPLDMAKVLLIHQKMGLASDATLSTKAGYDWHEELLRKLQEAEQKAALNAREMGEEEREKKKQGLPNLLDDKKNNDAAAKAATTAAGEKGTPGGGRGPGSGDGGTKASKDDLGAGKTSKV